MEKKPFWTGPKRPSNNPIHHQPYNRNFDRNAGNKDKSGHAINDQIRASEVRLVGDNVEPGVYPIGKAIRLADELGLDLIEIASTANPPVCKVMDYQKFLFQLRKRLKEQKSKSTKVVVKELRFGPQTDEHDYNFKLKHAIEFLKEGDKVKSYVFFRGRSILFKEQGEVLLLRFANDLEDYGKLEQMPILEGKRMTIMISPKKQGVAPKKKEDNSPEEDAGKPAE
jgi:translation initiation factor IF-3